MAEVRVVFGPCAGASAHGMVLTPDDDEYDPEVIGFITDNTYQYGYCSRCGTPCRWVEFHWTDWDVPTTDRRREIEAATFALLYEADVYSFILVVT